MKIKDALIIWTPPVLVTTSVAIFNPAVLAWPVVAGFGVVLGVCAARVLLGQSLNGH